MSQNVWATIMPFGPVSLNFLLAQKISGTAISPIWHGFAPSFVNYKKGCTDSQPRVIKFTSCLLMVGGSLRVLQLLPPLKLVAMI